MGLPQHLQTNKGRRGAQDGLASASSKLTRDGVVHKMGLPQHLRCAPPPHGIPTEQRHREVQCAVLLHANARVCEDCRGHCCAAARQRACLRGLLGSLLRCCTPARVLVRIAGVTVALLHASACVGEDCRGHCCDRIGQSLANVSVVKWRSKRLIHEARPHNHLNINSSRTFTAAAANSCLSSTPLPSLSTERKILCAHRYV